MEGSADTIIHNLVNVITEYSLNILGAIIILIIGTIVARLIRKGVYAGLGKVQRVDDTLRTFFSNLARYIVLIITIIAMLGQFGIQTASLIAIFATAGLAIGLALQGTLSNIAAGVMLLIFRPFKVGDFVETAGIAGTVQSITLFVTELSTPDNVQILAPNGQVWGAAVKNYSFHPTRRVDLAIGIDYADDIGKAMTAIHSVLDADQRTLRDPEPMVAVTELADNSVNLTVRVWCQAGDYWALKFDLTKTIKERLDTEGITIPFPQRTVHLLNVQA
ncbi:MAG: mechanosensitive ion channel [Nitrospirales bacterium]|nr:mechanosensitive ion channel [Nitrospirales bacterium]